MDERIPWKLCCTWTVLREGLGCVAMVMACGCSGESAFVLWSLETSAVVTTGVLDFWWKKEKKKKYSWNVTFLKCHNCNHGSCVFLFNWWQQYPLPQALMTDWDGISIQY